MKIKHSENAIPVAEQAAEWFVELSEPPVSEDARRRFFGWLKRSPQHVEEFLAIAVMDRQLSHRTSMLADVIADVAAMKREKAGAIPLVTGISSHAQPAPGRRAPRRVRALAWASAASLAALAAIYVVQVQDVQPAIVSHRTDLGEQRSIALSDGSIVMLNTMSEATVRFEDSTRRVTLLTGEAMFDVARDQERPFVVDAGDISLNVIGTKFSVYRQRDATRVAVLEGTVRVASARLLAETIVLEGGEGAVFPNEGSVHRVEPFDVEKAVAWTERRLMFDNARLADVVREFNRYNRLQLTVEDPALADRQVTTVVNAHDVSALIGFLQLQPDVKIDYGPDTIRIKTEME